MTEIEKLEDIILNSKDEESVWSAIQDRKYLLDHSITDPSYIQVLNYRYQEKMEECKKKMRMIYECLSGDIKENYDWWIEGKFLVRPGDNPAAIQDELFSCTNPCYLKERIDVFSVNKDSINKLYEKTSQEEVTLDLCLINGEMIHANYPVYMLNHQHGFSISDLLGATNIVTEVVLCF